MYNETYEFYKNNEGDKIYWVRVFIDGQQSIGTYAISFDKETVYYLFTDYPHKFTKEQKELFDKENPYWADFFSGRV